MRAMLVFLILMALIAAGACVLTDTLFPLLGRLGLRIYSSIRRRPNPLGKRDCEAHCADTTLDAVDLGPLRPGLQPVGFLIDPRDYPSKVRKSVSACCQRHEDGQ